MNQAVKYPKLSFSWIQIGATWSRINVACRVKCYPSVSPSHWFVECFYVHSHFQLCKIVVTYSMTHFNPFVTHFIVVIFTTNPGFFFELLHNSPFQKFCSLQNSTPSKINLWTRSSGPVELPVWSCCCYWDVMCEAWRRSVQLEQKKKKKKLGLRNFRSILTEKQNKSSEVKWWKLSDAHCSEILVLSDC